MKIKYDDLHFFNSLSWVSSLAALYKCSGLANAGPERPGLLPSDPYRTGLEVGDIICHTKTSQLTSPGIRPSMHMHYANNVIKSMCPEVKQRRKQTFYGSVL